MAQGQLKAYVQRMKKQGYPTESIRQALRAEGYNDARINAALGKGVSKQLFLVGLIALAVILVFILMGILFIVLAPEEPATKIKVSVSGIPGIVDPGGVVSFNANVQGAEAAFIQFNIVHQKSRELITQGEGNEGTLSFTVPKTAPSGTYKLNIIAFANGEQDRTEARFEVPGETTQPTPGVTPSIETTQCPGGCNDFNICTEDTCVNGKCEFKKVVPCCGDGVCERGETDSSCAEDCAPRPPTRGQAVSAVMKQAETLANSQPLEAAQLCRSLSRQADIDTCLGNIAKQANLSAICGQIRDPLDRDVCYMDFALKRNQFEVCDRITDRTMKQGCISVGRLKKRHIKS